MKRIAFVPGAIVFLSIILIFTVLVPTEAYMPDPGTNTAGPYPYLPTPIKPGKQPPPGNGPRDGVPLCPTHDLTAWHSVYEAARDCHYDHHHGCDPYDPEIVALLGMPDEYTGQGISYSWETPNENKLKHRAYFWIWQVNDSCVNSLIADLCVKAFRMQIHADMGIVGFNARFHSIWNEALACDLDNITNCGIIKLGGHVDTGCTYIAYFGPLVDVPANPDNCLEDFPNGGAYRIISDIKDKPRILSGGTEPRVQWGYAKNYTDLGQHIDILVFSNIDAYVVVNPDDTTKWEYVCDDFQCPYNGSLTQVADFKMATQPSGTEIAWTDLAGYIDPSCTATGPNCVPYVRINWPKKGSAGYHRNRQFPGDHPRDPSHYYEFDQSPGQIGTGGEFWLVPTDHDPRP